MKHEFELKSQSEIFKQCCRLIQYLWKNGNEEVLTICSYLLFITHYSLDNIIIIYEIALYPI